MRTTTGLPVALLVGALPLASGTAEAQDEHQPEAAGSPGEPVLEVIVVTGRKREETVQEIPTAVTALSRTELEEEGIDTVEELVQRTPGVSLSIIGAPFNDQISIRGQGVARQINAEVATGIYRNGAFIAGGNVGGATYSRLDLFDVERIEVYRGPQGALFGRNAIGGAVNVISARPGDEFEAYTELGYGENDRAELRGVINTPFSDAVAGRFGLLYIDQDEGFFTNAIDGSVLDEEQALGARAGLRADIGERTTLDVTIDYFDEELPSLSHNTFNPNVPGDDPFVSALNSDSRFDREEHTAIMELAREFDIGTFVALAFHKDRDSSTLDDLDAFLNVPVPAFSNLERVNTDDFSRSGLELRISNAEGPLSWVVGGELLTLENRSVVTVRGAPPPAAFQNSVSDTRSDDLSFAVFGLLGYDFDERWNLTGELRFTQDDKELDLAFQGFTPTGAALPLVTASESETFDNVSPVVTLKYEPGDRLNVYGRFATGFRAGGFNFRPDVATPPRFSLPYDEEAASSYELGLKSLLAGGAVQFNFAAYHTTTDDLQLNRTLIEGVTIINFVENSGESEIDGVEAEVSAGFGLADTGAELRFDLAASWNDSEFTAGPFEGAAIPFVRDTQLSFSTKLTVPLPGEREFFGAHTFRGQWGGWEDEPTNRPLDDVRLHNLRLGFRSERWSVVGEYENVDDYIYVVQRLNPNVNKTTPPGRWFVRFRLNY